MIRCAFDPGQSGGVAFIVDDVLASAGPLPVIGKIVDCRAIVTLLNMQDPQQIIVEQQSIRQGQGGAMAIGSNYGRLLGAIEMAGYPYKIVTPASWKRAARIPRGVVGKEKKQASFQAALTTFGADKLAELRLTPTKDGPVEAALIAYYGS